MARFNPLQTSFIFQFDWLGAGWAIVEDTLLTLTMVLLPRGCTAEMIAMAMPVANRQ
jgi:hypothetical protein